MFHVYVNNFNFLDHPWMASLRSCGGGMFDSTVYSQVAVFCCLSCYMNHGSLRHHEVKQPGIAGAGILCVFPRFHYTSGLWNKGWTQKIASVGLVGPTTLRVKHFTLGHIISATPRWDVRTPLSTLCEIPLSVVRCF